MTITDWVGVVLAIITPLGSLFVYVSSRYEKLSDRVSACELNDAAYNQRLKSAEEKVKEGEARAKDKHAEILRSLDKIENRKTWEEGR